MFTLILFFPFFNSFLLLLFGRKLGIKGGNYISCTNMLITTLISVLFFYEMMLTESIVLIKYGEWINYVLLNTNLSFYVDKISICMVLVVNMISLLVHIYSVSYMHGDPHSIRFMGYLSLFTFFMLILIISQNYIQLFIGWEGVGLCSYLLINFWYTRIQANKAAIKAMLVNRIGDACLIAAIILLWIDFGSINFTVVFPISITKTSFLIPLLLLSGAVGKSAQIGLHTWLPDAMEGPTPVSALIHAATMVTAGVYLIIRSSYVFEGSPFILIITAIIGSLTALFAATIGLAQNDIKKIIAYSTCSQLGFMVLSCGLSYYSLALFHLVNHAFFKALLFLAAGSIIHNLIDEQDIRKMGGNIISQPLSYMFIFIGSFALAGFPFLAGYYSKDLLLELSFKQYYIIYVAWLGLLATFITAFYSFKLISRTFILFNNSYRNTWYKSKENDWILLTPLIILSVGSVVSGFLFNYLIIEDLIHPTLKTFLKMGPLVVSVVGGTSGILLLLITKYTWNLFFKFRINNLYQFLVSAWDFDKIIHKFIISFILNKGYKITFKTFDMGILEKLGPSGLIFLIPKYSKNLSLIQTGYLFNYTILLILFSSLFIIMTNPFDFEGFYIHLFF